MSYQDVVLVFPGQGSQKLGMGRDWAAFPEFQTTLEEASETLGMDLARLCFEDPGGQLALTQFTQVAILTVSTGIQRVLATHYGFTPRLVAGHSLGEYSALVAAEALSFKDALRTVWFRGEAMHRALPVGLGAMAAYVGSHGDAVVERCRQVSRPDAVVEVVNFNSPTQLVLSGHAQALESFGADIEREELGSFIKLPVSTAFHCSLMRPAAQEMERWLADIRLQPLQVPLVANVDARLYRGNEYSADLLVRQLANPVLWVQSVRRILEELPNALWLEVGPGEVLTKLLKRTQRQCVIRATDRVTALSDIAEQLGDRAA